MFSKQRAKSATAIMGKFSAAHERGIKPVTTSTTRIRIQENTQRNIQGTEPQHASIRPQRTNSAMLHGTRHGENWTILGNKNLLLLTQNRNLWGKFCKWSKILGIPILMATTTTSSYQLLLSKQPMRIACPQETSKRPAKRCSKTSKMMVKTSKTMCTRDQ